MYNIAPKPTRYAGVQFRSRLEARWAAFFDLSGWKWDYEPIELRGWAPDFCISTPFTPVFAEVKPADMGHAEKVKVFKKAWNHWQTSQVLLLGLSPIVEPPYDVGSLLDPPTDAEYEWYDLYEFFGSTDRTDMWRDAGNIVQWHPSY